MAPYNVRGGNISSNRMRGLKYNRSSGFTTNRLGLSGFRSSGFLGNRSRGLYSSPSTQRYTDARQVLQQKKVKLRLGCHITDLSQKLASRTVNSGRLNDSNRSFSKPVNVARVNRNFFGNLHGNDRFSRNRTSSSQIQFGNKQLARKKLIQVHGGGITVTAKQNIPQRRLWKPVQDELEEMTLEDLPKLENVTPARPFNQSLESRLLPNTAKESSDTFTTVLITNLKQTVSEEDINELFSVVGQMTSAQLLHPGTALVTYVRKEDAATALEYYNNVTLDGMAMRCTILSLDQKTSKPSVSSRLGERTHSPLSESFLSPASRSSSFLSPASRSSSFLCPASRSSSLLSPTIPRTNFPTSGLRSAGGRDVQAQVFPTRTQSTNKMHSNPKFTVCLN